jgi:hypothetical protein
MEEEEYGILRLDLRNRLSGTNDTSEVSFQALTLMGPVSLQSATKISAT